MSTRHASRWFWPALTGLCLIALFLTNHAAAIKTATQTQDAVAKGSVATAGGLTVVTFIVKPGIVRVNLPDDMRAGDTISGTVSAEPNGNSKEEQTTNRTELKKLGIQLIGSQADKPEDVGIGDVSTVFKYSLINDRESGNVFTVGLLLGGQTLTKVNVPLTPSGAVITPDPKITAPTTASGAVITPDPKIILPKTPSGAVITPDPKITQPDTIPSGESLPPGQRITPPASLPLDPKYFDLPLLGQTGRPMLISGPFDGDSNNTKLTIGNKPAQVLAESPREIVVASPSNISGPIEIAVKEGDKETKGSYRNVGVNLSAPKTNLLKGEKTELRVEVNGLEALKQPVPLTITYGGVIVMEGGPYQPLLIQPSQVSADGRYTTTRGITGVEAGGWTATATVVTSRFDFCLQDDATPSRGIHWNTFTGDYNFICPGCFPQRTGETAQTGGAATTFASPGSPATALTGTGSMTRKGCIITLSHNAPDRRVFARLDACTNSGSSTVESPATKTKFTITDRNMADNPCPAR